MRLTEIKVRHVSILFFRWFSKNLLDFTFFLLCGFKRYFQHVAYNALLSASPQLPLEPRNCYVPILAHLCIEALPQKRNPKSTQFTTCYTTTKEKPKPETFKQTHEKTHNHRRKKNLQPRRIQQQTQIRSHRTCARIKFRLNSLIGWNEP